MAKKVLVSGSSGLIGSALTTHLKDWGYRVVRMVRSERAAGEDTIFWDPERRSINVDDLEGFDAVIHLAGENIANARWTEAKKRKIRNSRVIGTQVLCEALAKLKRPPKVLVCASAVGFYGSDRDAVRLSEESDQGTGFLAGVVGDWERATLAARTNGIRVVNLRMGLVLSANGGALKKMLTPFKWCLGGIIGTGEQYVSWIAIDDLVGVIYHVMTHDHLDGPVNAVSPEPITNRTFTKVLGKVLARPTALPMPLFAARLAFGEMVDELLLASQRVYPQKLLESGYTFQFPSYESALRRVLE